jgi:hypothetical protein
VAVRIFLVSGGRDEAAKDRMAPRGQKREGPCLILLMAALLLVSPLTARALPPRYNARGRTVRGTRRLHQRLSNHLHGRSSFVITVLMGKGAKLRSGYKSRFLAIEDSRLRALVEAFAIGQLCPDHLGHGGS